MSAAERAPRPIRPGLLSNNFSLLVQLLLGMVINLFVVLPKVHPGANAPEYFTGVVQGVLWAVTQWPWVALHVAFGVLLAIGGIGFAVRAWRVGQRDVFVASVVGSVALVAAAFNGASFVNYGSEVSSYIMAASFAVAIGAYVLARYWARQA